MVKIMETPIKMDDLGGPPLFLETIYSSTFNLFRENPKTFKVKVFVFLFSQCQLWRPRFAEAFQTERRCKNVHLSWHSWKNHHSPCSCTNHCRLHHLALAFEQLPEDSHWSFGHGGSSLWSFLPPCFSRA